MIIESKKNFIPEAELATICRRGGALVFMIPLNIFLCILLFPNSLTSHDSMYLWVDLDYTFRLFAFVTLIILGAASNM